MANYNEILKHWNDTHVEEMEELQFWLDDFITEDADTPEELAFQLTAYEQWGCIDFDKWVDDQLNIKLINMDDSELVALHNEACSEHDYMDDYIFTDLEEMLEGLDLESAIQRTYFGDYHGGTIGYYQFNGYANIVEDHPSQLINEELVVKALREQVPTLSEDALNVLIQMTIELVKKGY